MSKLTNENPIPQGKYVPATRFGNMIYTSGMTPRKNGELIQKGKVKTDEEVSVYKQAVIQAAKNALTAVKSELKEQEKIAQVISLTVYINAEQTFEAHSKLADYASSYLLKEIGESSLGTRTAVGVASLPGDAPVEIQLIAAVSS